MIEPQKIRGEDDGMEILCAYAFLRQINGRYESRFNTCLDSLFMKSSEPILLELEEICADSRKTIDRLIRHIRYEAPILRTEVFSRELMRDLKELYEDFPGSLTELCRLYSGLWALVCDALPGNAAYEEPFLSLSYAGDPLAWGDEQQTRQLLEGAFRYFG